MRIFMEKLRGILTPRAQFDPDPLYQAIVRQARSPAFYRHPHAVPDTLDGRFDSLCLHMFLVLRSLSAAAEADEAIRKKVQNVQNRFFTDMDQSMREIGVGDMSIGKHVTKMAKAYFGRVVAYEQAFHDPAQLAAKLGHNILRRPNAEAGDSEPGDAETGDAEAGKDIPVENAASLKLATYCLSQAECLARQDANDVLGGTVTFVPV